jgi:hypothetical protein
VPVSVVPNIEFGPTIFHVDFPNKYCALLKLLVNRLVTKMDGQMAIYDIDLRRLLFLMNWN